MDSQRRRSLVFAGLLVCASPQGALCAEAIVEKTLNVDLAPLIDVAAEKQERFAVTLPHALSTESAGSWTRTEGVSIWRYSVRIPTAVSMSFHADRYRLPSGAVLEVSGANGSTAVYSPADGGNNGLWSRIQRGDTLIFELRAPTSVESEVEFTLASLQAGYRGLGGGVADHPHFRSLKKSASVNAAAVAGCIENFECHKTAGNSHSSDATAAVVVGGVALCTGTLINNLRNDGTPYILTARHCQDTPSSGVTIYWDATTPCGQELGAFYDTNSTAWNAGAETVFEQQDVWMIRFSPGISAKRAYFAGWDVTGGAFVGGYSPHHAMGRARQYVEWFGQAHPVTLPGSALEVGFDSDYWGVVNSLGSVGSGASGGGLFDANHRVVGVASLAHLVDGPGSDGVCPTTPPPAPDEITSTALYNSLAAVWESNADTTSSTNPVTLKSLLDPDNTSNRIADGFEMLAGVYLGASNSYSGTGRTITLTWGSGGLATSCTASGGTPGDGWTGSVALTGSAEVTQYQAGITTYTLRCTDGARFASRSVRVIWELAPPSLLLAAANSAQYVGTTVRMHWRGTAIPCVASGGVAGDGWAGAKTPTGALDVPLLQTGDISYTMTCGTGPRAAVETMIVRSWAPIATLEPVQTSIRINSELLVMQAAGGVNCTREGGAPDDGWAGITGSYPSRLKSAAPGTYRYTLTCYGGPHGSPAPAQATMDITYTTDAPAVTLTASHAIAQITEGFLFVDDPRFAIEFTWQSNIAPCELTYDGPGDNDGRLHPVLDHPSTGKEKSWQIVPGFYEYTVFCKSGDDVATASVTVEFTPQEPIVNIYPDSSPQPARDQGFYITWGSNALPCVASGGSPGDGWAGPRSSTNGYELMTIREAGTYTYSMTCGTGPDTVTGSTTVTIPPAMLEFEPHVTQALATHGVELRWTGTVGNCVQVGDWSGQISLSWASGWDIVHSNSSGVRTYTLRCGVSDFIEASTQITWLPLPTVDINASAASASVNQPVTLSWTSKDADSCTAQPAEGVPEWSGTLPPSGSRVVTRTTPGAVGFYVDCGDVVDAVVVEWRAVTASPRTPSAPTVTLTVDHATRVVGEPVTLNWTTTHSAACRATQGVSGDAWVGALPVSGARSITVDTPGTYTWKIACEGAPPAAVASVSVTFTARPSAGGNPNPGAGSGTGGGGGGGGIDPLMLMLGLSLIVSSKRRRGRKAPMGTHAVLILKANTEARSFLKE